MRIKISDKESYEIEIPESADAEELGGLMERLGRIQKHLLKEPFIASFKQPQTEQKEGKRAYRKTRNPLLLKIRQEKETAKKVLILGYYGTKEQRKLVAEKNKVDWIKIQQAGYQARVKFGITAKEVGLLRFPKVQETQLVDTLRIRGSLPTDEIVRELTKNE